MPRKQVGDIESFKSRLKALGMKTTPQRIAVHEAMLTLVHASAESVVEYIQASSDVHVTVSSVYNILSVLADKGVYQRRMSGGSKMFFDVITDNHIHIYDSVGEEFKDIMDEELSALVEAHLKGRRFRGYKLDRVEIQLVCHPTRRTVKK